MTLVLEVDLCICEATKSLYNLSGDGKEEAPVCNCLLIIQCVMCHEIAFIAASSESISYSPTRFIVVSPSPILNYIMSV